ncbi:hypothetical protein LTR84_009971 [Exophiala bonariae]|uniref:N-acetyltransferase domain-containing protein n=1 Tax=Exophiala bonariae TaxID=1690606 RepID=A0AAV9NLF0_9EURO|nr:hypothetical protein LTR84_009971 [Exophiala bonariae]
MGIEIHPITAADIPSVADCIQQSFADDPYHIWAFDQRPGKFDKERNLASLRAKCEWGMRNALFYVAKDSDDPSGQVLGVGMWMKPRNATEPETWAEWLDGYLLWFKQGWNLVRYQGRGGLNTKRYWIWKQVQADVQAEIWDDPTGYYFCNIVAVRPGNQGKGIGRKLIELITKTADAEDRKCYLESSKAVPNIAIYEKLGFTVAKKMECEEGGDKIDLYCMFREPRPKSKPKP